MEESTVDTRRDTHKQKEVGTRGNSTSIYGQTNHCCRAAYVIMCVVCVSIARHDDINDTAFALVRTVVRVHKSRENGKNGASDLSKNYGSQCSKLATCIDSVLNAYRISTYDLIRFALSDIRCVFVSYTIQFNNCAARLFNHMLWRS